MSNNRRKFMVCSGMAAGGAMLGRLVAEPKFTEGESAEADVKVLVSRYGRVVKMTKDSSNLIHVKAKMVNHRRMAKLFTEQQKLPLSEIRVTAQNTLEFTHRGARFSISHQA